MKVNKLKLMTLMLGSSIFVAACNGGGSSGNGSSTPSSVGGATDTKIEVLNPAQNVKDGDNGVATKAPDGSSDHSDTSSQSADTTSTITPEKPGKTDRSAFEINNNTIVKLANGQTLTKIVIPEGITEIADNAFNGNTNLKYVYLESVTKVGKNAFFNNINLIDVHMDNVQEIGESAFANTKKLSGVSMYYAKDLNMALNAFDGAKEKFHVYIESDSECHKHFKHEQCAWQWYENFDKPIMQVTNDHSDTSSQSADSSDASTIDNATVTQSLNTTNVTDASSQLITSVEDNGSAPQPTVTIPDVINVKDRVPVVVTQPHMVATDRSKFIIKESVIIRLSDDGLDLTSIVIPEGITEIADNAFANNTNLQNVSMNLVTTVGKRAFANNTNLEWVSMDNVINVKQDAFADDTRLQRVFMNKVNKIGKRAFVNTPNLQDLFMNDVRELSVGSNAFDGAKENFQVYIWHTPACANNFAYKRCAYDYYEGATYAGDEFYLIN